MQQGRCQISGRWLGRSTAKPAKLVLVGVDRLGELSIATQLRPGPALVMRLVPLAAPA